MRQRCIQKDNNKNSKIQQAFVLTAHNIFLTGFESVYNMPIPWYDCVLCMWVTGLFFDLYSSNNIESVKMKILKDVHCKKNCTHWKT